MRSEELALWGIEYEVCLCYAHMEHNLGRETVLTNLQERFQRHN